MLTTFEILNAQGKVGVGIFIKAIAPYKATGKTEQSAFYRIEGKDTVISLSIIARKYVKVLETGSKPAKTLVPSKEMIDELKPWAKSRGIPDEAVYPIAKKLLKEGQQLNRNVYSEQMNEWADSVVDEVVSELAGLAIDKLVNTWE